MYMPNHVLNRLGLTLAMGILNVSDHQETAVVGFKVHLTLYLYTNCHIFPLSH